jgi:FMN reductase
MRRLVVISAGTGTPSTTRQLAARIAQRSAEVLEEEGSPVAVGFIEVGPLAVDAASAAVAGFPNGSLEAAIDSLAAADAVIAATPVYKAGMSGLFKTFIDILDDDLLIGKPVLLAAAGGTARHALVTEDQMRALFAYMRAFVLPTAVYAAPEDWATPELGERIDRAAAELAVLVGADVGQRLAERAWSSYEHPFAGSTARGDAERDVDFDTPLMRLAIGKLPDPERPHDT